MIDGHRRIRAYFRSTRAARRAGDRLEVGNPQVQRVARSDVRHQVGTADQGLGRVDIGWPAWAGLLAGAVAGGILGALFYKGVLAWNLLAPLMAGRGTAVVFVGAGVLGSVGWLIGALIRLFSMPAPAPRHELEVEVPLDQIPEVERRLADAGAAAVVVEPPR